MADAGHQFYKEEDAEEILRIAASITAPEGAIDRARLLATAAELGISAEAVEIAEKKHADEKLDRELRREFDAGQVRDFKTHLISFVLVNGFLVVINLLTGIREFWAIYSIASWGLGLAFHWFAVYGKFGSGYQDSFERWRAAKLGLESKEHDARPYAIGIHVGTGRHRGRNRGRHWR